MGIWLDALDEAAAGNLLAAIERVRLELPLELRTFTETDAGARTYSGPVMSAVRRFIAKQSKAEQVQVARYDCELVDMIVDDVAAAVERSLHLLEICGSQPTASLEELVALVPWADGLKRNATWKRARVADTIRSMIAEGLPIPEQLEETLGDEGVATFEFNEIAYAADPERIELSWRTFKRKNNLAREYFCLVDDEDDNGVSEEGVDYAGVRASKVAYEAQKSIDVELVAALHALGKDLTVELSEVLEGMHASRPVDGYRPVAWHGVFWSVRSDYEGLRLALKVLDPCCDTDGELAGHIAEHYKDVRSTSRPVIVRRRQALSSACEERIQLRIKERIVGE